MILDMEKLSVFAWQAGSVAIIMLAGLLCFAAARKGLERLFARGLINQTFFLVVKNSIRWLLIITVAIAAMQQMGIRITNIITALLTVAGMIAIGFIAVWSILSNVLAAMLLAIFRNFDIGDEIEVVEPVGGDGLKGRVVGFNVMFTTVVEGKDLGDQDMLTQIPNNIFFQKTLRRRPGRKTEALGQHLFVKPIKTGQDCRD